jgi:hypothetical protein
VPAERAQVPVLALAALVWEEPARRAAEPAAARPAWAVVAMQVPAPTAAKAAPRQVIRAGGARIPRVADVSLETEKNEEVWIASSLELLAMTELAIPNQLDIIPL